MADLAAVPSIDRDECQAELIAAAAELADDVSEESSLIGYVILAAYSDGATRSAGYRPSTDDHKIGAVMWESWMGDLLKSQFAYQHSMSAAYDALYD